MAAVGAALGGAGQMAGGVSQVLHKDPMGTMMPQGSPVQVAAGALYNQAAGGLSPLHVNQSQDYIPQGGQLQVPGQNNAYDNQLMQILGQFTGVR